MKWSWNVKKKVQYVQYIFKVANILTIHRTLQWNTQWAWNVPQINLKIINTPGVARAVLQTPLWFTDWFIKYVVLLFRIFETLSIPNRNSWEAEMLGKCSPTPPWVTCHVSHVTCQMSHIPCHMWRVKFNFFFFFYLDKVNGAIRGEGLLSTSLVNMFVLFHLLVSFKGKSCKLSL